MVCLDVFLRSTLCLFLLCGQTQRLQRILCLLCRIVGQIRDLHLLDALADSDCQFDLAVLVLLHELTCLNILLIDDVFFVFVRIFLLCHFKLNVGIVQHSIVIVHANDLRHFIGRAAGTVCSLSHQQEDHDCCHNDHNDGHGSQNRNDQRLGLFLLRLVFLPVVVFIVVRSAAGIVSVPTLGRPVPVLFRRCEILGLFRRIVIAEDDLVVCLECLNIPDHIRCRLIPLCGVLFHGVHDDLFQTGGNVRVDISGAHGNILHMHHSDRDRVIRVERLSAGEHLIEHDTDGIKVTLGIGHIATGLLRADIMHRTDCLVCGSPALFPGELGDTKVHDLDRAVCQQHDVLGLDIPVNNATAVGVLERTEDLDDKVYGVLPVQHVFAVDVIFQGNAVNVLHDDILHLV